jgi:hypothetical protein
MLAYHHISVARHTAELISSQTPKLLFKALLELVGLSSNSAGENPRNILLQNPKKNSHVEEHEGQACHISDFACI